MITMLCAPSHVCIYSELIELLDVALSSRLFTLHYPDGLQKA